MSAYTEIPKIIAETGELPPKVLNYLASQFIRTGTLSTSVDQYGATGDGTTDNTSAIQAALNDAAQPDHNGTVYLPGGTYAVTGLDVPDNVTLTGAGNAVLRVLPSTRERVIDVHGDRAGLTNISIDGNSAAHTIGRQYLVWVSGEGTRIADLNITDSRDRCVHVAPTARHISISNVILARNGVLGNCNGFDIKGQYVTVSGCHVYDHGNGHAFITANTLEARPAYITFVNCVVERSEHNAFTLETGSHHVIIANCVAKDVPQAVKGDQSCRYITVDSCHFENIELGTAFNMNMVANTTVIGTTMKNAGGGFMVGANSIITGCYAENIDGAYAAFYARDNTVINGCVVQGGTGLTAAIYTRHGTITDNTIVNADCELAIYTQGTSKIRGNTITDCSRPDQRELIIAETSDDATAGNEISGNTIQQTTGEFHATRAVITLRGNGSIVQGNTVAGTFNTGVHVLNNTDHYLVSHNVLPGGATKVSHPNSENHYVGENI